MTRRALPAFLVLLLSTAPAAAATRLVPVTREIADVCRAAQAVAAYRVLCPSRLPRGTSGPGPPEPLGVGSWQRGTILDFGYSAPYEDRALGRRTVERLNRPERFLHFVVGRATQGVPAGARPARLGGRVGLLAPGDALAGYAGGPYFGNHHRFIWRERGVRYVATLHTFGDRATRRLLGRIVAGLRPAGALRPLRPARRVGARAVWVGPRPVSLAATPAGLWVTTTGSNSNGYSGGVTRIDPDTLARRALPPVGRPWEGWVAAGPAGVWAVRPLRRLDRAGVGPRLGTRRHVRGLAVGADAIWIVANALWDGRAHGALLRVDPVSRRVTARVRLRGGVSSVAEGYGGAWVVGSDAGTVSRVDPVLRRVVESVRVGRQPYGVAVGAGAIWVTNAGDGTVTRVDPLSRREVATIPVGAAPHGVAVDARGVWVAVTGRGAVVRIDPAQNRVVETLPVGGDPISVASDGARLWIGMGSDGVVVRVVHAGAHSKRVSSALQGGEQVTSSLTGPESPARIWCQAPGGMRIASPARTAARSPSTSISASPSTRK